LRRDGVEIPNYNMLNKSIKDIFIGVLLGDAHIGTSGLDKAFISFEQSKFEYLNYLHKLISLCIRKVLSWILRYLEIGPLRARITNTKTPCGWKWSRHNNKNINLDIGEF
jgi:hypothetical protein